MFNVEAKPVSFNRAMLKTSHRKSRHFLLGVTLTRLVVGSETLLLAFEGGVTLFSVCFVLPFSFLF